MTRVATTAVAAIVLATSAPAGAAEVNIYSARQEALIKPLLDAFVAETGIEVNVMTGKADALLGDNNADAVRIADRAGWR